MIHEDGVHKYSLVNLERLLQDCHGELVSETKDYVTEWFLRGRRQGFFRIFRLRQLCGYINLWIFLGHGYI